MLNVITECRVCKSTQLSTVLNLGNHYIADCVAVDDFDSADHLRAPLELVLCKNCNLIQLLHSVHPDRLYRHSSRLTINEHARQRLREVCNVANYLTDFEPTDSVLDIGSNDGTLLSMYRGRVKTVGIESSKNLLLDSHRNKLIDVGVWDYFSAKAVQPWAPYKVITAVGTLSQVDDPRQFLTDCKRVLHEDGLLVIQVKYLKNILEQLMFDCVSHKCLTYFGVSTFQYLVDLVGLDIVGVQVRNSNITFMLKHTGHDIETHRVSPDIRMTLYGKHLQLQRDEAKFDMGNPYIYQCFTSRMNEIIRELSNYLNGSGMAGEKTYAYGISSRGSTLLQCLQLDKRVITAVAERDPNKIGYMTTGTWLPIVTEDEARRHATQFLVLPYYFWETIKRREYKWIQDGGKMVIPLSEPIVYGRESAYSLLTGDTIQEQMEDVL